ncbi:DNA repair protein RecN [Roseivirga sp. BDSF3-8]|uniref:DNA repair protein RecN n=1 Tax=Roseivirga sp. BDSF3-8 TaxID=3241598 RepID=UPI0035327667
MLKHLLIKNYALISELEMEPASGLNIVTGETGAGKSIMLGAIGLLLGQRADTKVLFDEDKKCVIEGSFAIGSYQLKPVFEEEDLDYETEALIRREISPAGKSRAFVNDTPVTLSVLRRIGSYLMDIHSQHDTLRLGSHTFQLRVVDAYANTSDERKAYSEAWQTHKKALTAYETLREEAEKIREEADYKQFLLNELLEANLTEADETEMLEEELRKLEHAEEIKQVLFSAAGVLGKGDEAVTDPLHNILSSLNKIARYSDEYKELADRLNSAIIELEDIGGEASSQEDQVVYDPERTQQVQERLDLLFKLQQKHRVASPAELIEIRNTLDDEASRHADLDNELSRAKSVLDAASKSLNERALKLSNARNKSFTPISKEVGVLLKDLGMPDARLHVESKEVAPGPSGIDEIHFRFSANKGVNPEDLDKVASGGEFSRLMFCIKYIIADKTALPTIIFDEIDTGISGEIALKMVRMMKSMARGHQVVSISHLPQIAAKGDAHYHVYKDNSQSRTISRIRRLSDEDRVEEIARMIGGDKPSQAAYTSAKELINN